MKRSLAVIGFSYLAASVIALFVSKNVCMMLTFLLLAGLIVSLLFKRWRKNTIIVMILVSSSAALMMSSAYTELKITPLEQLKGKTYDVTAQLCDMPYQKNDRYYYTLEMTEIKNIHLPDHTKILVSSEKLLDMDFYDTVQSRIKFYADSHHLSDDSVSRGILLKGRLEDDNPIVIEKSSSKPMAYYALAVRRYLQESVHTLLTEEQAGFVTALLTGDKTGMSEQQKESLYHSGIAHMVAVSGFHLSVLTKFSMTFLCFITNRRKRLAALLCSVLVFSYMAVTGFSLSILRAGIMQILMLFSTASYREADSYNSLGTAALIICFLNPYAAGDTGFLLSFSATFGIVLCSSKIHLYLTERTVIKTAGSGKIVSSVVCGIISIFSVTVSAMMFTFPIVLLTFRQIAVYSVLTNLIVSVAVSVLLIVSVLMILCTVSGIVSFAAAPLALLCGVISDFVTGTAALMSSLPFAVIKCCQEFIPYWTAAVVIIGIVVFTAKFVTLKKAQKIKYYTLFVLLSLVICHLFDFAVKEDSTKISLIDTGDGLSVVMQKNESFSVLYCGGDYDGSTTVSDYLDDSGAEKITLFLMTDYRMKNSRFALSILKDYPVQNMELYDEETQYRDVLSYAKRSKCYHSLSSESQQLNRLNLNGDGITVYKRKNTAAVLIDANGQKLLICSDKTDCSDLPEDFRDVDFLILNGEIDHTENISAEHFLVSDAAENIDRYAEYNSNEDSSVYFTGGNGTLAIRIYSNGQSVIRRENAWLS